MLLYYGLHLPFNEGVCKMHRFLCIYQFPSWNLQPTRGQKLILLTISYLCIVFDPLLVASLDHSNSLKLKLPSFVLEKWHPKTIRSLLKITVNKLRQEEISLLSPSIRVGTFLTYYYGKLQTYSNEEPLLTSLDSMDNHRPAKSCCIFENKSQTLYLTFGGVKRFQWVNIV